MDLTGQFAIDAARPGSGGLYFWYEYCGVPGDRWCFLSIFIFQGRHFMSMVHQQSEKPVLRRVAGEPFGGLTGDEVLQLALCRIAQLRDEVSGLRQALLSAERASALKEVLLRNALRRELELRAQLIGGMS